MELAVWVTVTCADLARFAGSHIIADNPVEGILKLAGEIKADVIVMGTHDR